MPSLIDRVKSLVPKRDRLGEIRVDCTVARRHIGAVEAPTTPIQNRTEVTDHIRKLPREVTMSAIITRHPDNIPDFARGLTGKLSEPRLYNYHNEAWERLNAIRERGELFTVSTSLETIPNMMITSIESEQTSETSEALHLDIVLREVLQARVTFLANALDGFLQFVQPPEDAGLQGTEAIN